MMGNRVRFVSFFAVNFPPLVVFTFFRQRKCFSFVSTMWKSSTRRQAVELPSHPRASSERKDLWKGIVDGAVGWGWFTLGARTLLTALILQPSWKRVKTGSESRPFVCAQAEAAKGRKRQKTFLFGKNRCSRRESLLLWKIFSFQANIQSRDFQPSRSVNGDTFLISLESAHFDSSWGRESKAKAWILCKKLCSAVVFYWIGRKNREKRGIFPRKLRKISSSAKKWKKVFKD